MARSQKYSIPFQSFAGVACEVRIYEEGFTGSSTTISPSVSGSPGYAAAIPFEYDEDDDKELTHFLRIKTGYIRVVEKTFGSLSGIIPRSTFDHYVEFYYGTRLDFVGYMKCESYDNRMEAAPRELSFPVVSPMYLLESCKFSHPTTDAGIMNMSTTTIGALMAEVFSGLGVSYNIIYPVYDSSSTAFPWNGIISQTVMTPFNKELKPYEESGTGFANVFAPRTYKDLVEGICACFGWMCHETGTTLIFTKIDYTGQYMKLTTPTGTPTSYGQGSATMAIGTNRDDQASESTMMPVKEVEINVDGVANEALKLDTSLCKTHDSLPASWHNQGYGYIGIALEKRISDVDGYDIGVASFGAGGQGEAIGNLTNTGGLFPVVFGACTPDRPKISMTAFWVYKWPLDGGVDRLLISKTWWGQPPRNTNGQTALKITIERGMNLSTLSGSNWRYDLRLNLRVKVGDRYIDIYRNTSSTSPIDNAIEFKSENGAIVPNTDVPDCIMFYPNTSGWSSLVDKITIQLYAKGGEAQSIIFQGEYLKFSIEIAQPDDISNDYYISYSHRDKYVKSEGNGKGVDTCSIDVAINNYTGSIGTCSFMSPGTYAFGYEPNYLYMFSPQRFLTQRVAADVVLDENAYMKQINHPWWDNGSHLISSSFNPIEDEYTVILASV